MPVREGPSQPAPQHRNGRPPNKMRPVDGPAPYPAEKARGGEIVLRSPASRAVFIAGLVGIFVLLLLLRMFA